MNQLTALYAYFAAHHAQFAEAATAALALLNFLVKIALWLHPIPDWVALAEKRPRLAALLRLSMALGVNPISVLQSLTDLVRNEASKGTKASIQAFGVSASRPLFSPPTPKSERATLPPSPETPLPSPPAPAPAKKDPLS